ncbi:MAG: hypothetical protein WBO10_17115 [Pyrinomonadaceae bacterium]
MSERRIYQISLALPIIFPAISLVITPRNLDSIYGPIGTILTAFIFSGLVGGIPYGILAISLLVWMRNKDLSQVRRALLFSPLFLIPIFMVFSFIVAVVFINESPPDSAAQVYLMYCGLFTGYILAFGYFYVMIAFGAARLFRKKPFSKIDP